MTNHARVVWGTDVMIDGGYGDTLTIGDIKLADLDAADFRF